MLEHCLEHCVHVDRLLSIFLEMDFKYEATRGSPNADCKAAVPNIAFLEVADPFEERVIVEFTLCDGLIQHAESRTPAPLAFTPANLRVRGHLVQEPTDALDECLDFPRGQLVVEAVEHDGRHDRIDERQLGQIDHGFTRLCISATYHNPVTFPSQPRSPPPPDDPPPVPPAAEGPVGAPTSQGRAPAPAASQDRPASSSSSSAITLSAWCVLMTTRSPGPAAPRM